MAGSQARTDSTDIAAGFAEFAANLRFETLPPEVVAILKRVVLDSLGTTLAANTLGTGTDELFDIVQGAGGSPESTIIGFGNRVPATQAALINGAMAHSLNYDDTAEGGVHVGPTCLPAALAVGEASGPLGGADLLAALAAGAEVMVRLRTAINPVDGAPTEAVPQPTQMLGYFGAALCAGRVLGLKPERMQSALGLALMQAAGGRQTVIEARPAKAIYAGFSSHGGVLSALLADRGLEADCAVFEGEAGLFSTYYHGSYRKKALYDGLGRSFHLANVRFKPWPVTGRAHPFIRAALQLRDDGIDLSTVRGIQLRGGRSLVTFCEPLTKRRRPRTAVEAEDSIPFAVAKTLANGTIRLGDLQVDGLNQDAALRLAEVVDYEVDDALGSSGEVVITTAAGERHAHRSPGGAETLTHEQLLDKFRDCAQYAAYPRSGEEIERVVELVQALENVPDVGVLLRLLSGPNVGGTLA